MIQKMEHTRVGVRGQVLGVGGFSPEQLAWLNKIKDDVQGSTNVVGGRMPGTTQISQNAEMTVNDFNYISFNQEGGLLKARELFGEKLEDLLEELNCELIA